MPTRQEIITAARTWIETPYHHQARVKGIGVDCIGIVIGVCREIGSLPVDFDVNGYSPTPHGVLLLEIEKYCLSVDEPSLADMLVFRIRREPQHVGILAEDEMGNQTIVHAYEGVGKVCEHVLDSWWRDRIVACYQLPGVI